MVCSGLVYWSVTCVVEIIMACLSSSYCNVATTSQAIVRSVATTDSAINEVLVTICFSGIVSLVIVQYFTQVVKPKYLTKLKGDYESGVSVFFCQNFLSFIQK